MSLFNLEGKVALITGSTKGIGKAIAQRMAEQGAKVVVSSRNQELCDEVAGEINDSGGTAISVACNINYKEQLENLVAQTQQKLGNIDILVCNAAINPYFGPSQDIPDPAFDKVMHANIGSVHRLCQLVIPSMAENGGGAVIIISSIGGLKGSDALGAYAISNPDIYEATISKYPLRRIGEPDEIAGAAILLASDAGSFTTGQTIVIDGGGTIAG